MSTIERFLLNRRFSAGLSTPLVLLLDFLEGSGDDTLHFFSNWFAKEVSSLSFICAELSGVVAAFPVVGTHLAFLLVA